jgi:threonylcarbamoyladenosine tRNA methylthiotransferase CDKAL1
MGDIGDMEDAVRPGEGDSLQRLARHEVVPARVRGRRAADRPSSTLEGSIPGTHSVHVKTWGCSHNNSDGEYMAGQLAAYGYRVTEKMEDAELWVLNSCTVKNPSEEHFVTQIRQAREKGKRVVVAGCVPQGDRNNKELEGLSVIGVQQIDRVVEVVEETLKGHTVQLFGQKRAEGGRKAGGALLSLPKIRKNRLVEIIPINTGCLNQCTYCKTVHARGKLGSYPPEEIIERVKSVLKEGVREFWFTSEDLGTYGRDIGTSLPEMLWQVVECLPEGTMLRLGMTNPPYILEHRVEIAKILKHPRVYEFLHIPVQSGSDRVLSDMRRQYTIADFAQLVDHLRAEVPAVTIATDVICGFPTENDEDFQGTMDLVRKYQFPILYISQFYPRPGTPAAAMPQARTQIKKARSREVSAFFKSYFPYADRVGARYWVLVTDRAADGERLVAHNKAYEQVLLREEKGLMGSYVEVVITEVGRFHLLGELVDAAWWEKTPPLPPVAVSLGSQPSTLRADGGEWEHGGRPAGASMEAAEQCGADCDCVSTIDAKQTETGSACGPKCDCETSAGAVSPSQEDAVATDAEATSAAASGADGAAAASFNVVGMKDVPLCAVVGGLIALLGAVQAAENAGWIN